MKIALSWRALGLVIPVLLASPRLGDGTWRGAPAARLEPPPPPRSVNVWLDDSEGLDVDVAGLRQASREELGRSPILHPQLAARTLGAFTGVGSVAVVEGDDVTIKRINTGLGIDSRGLGSVTARFIQTFGDNYDQIAIFLGFPDRASPAALAYQQPVKNDIRGIGLGLFDGSSEYGTKGKLQTILNMKQIWVYGRDAAGDPDNGLYPVWAQEAAHRWLVYFRLQQVGDAAHNEKLLGRQKVHWARGVSAEGSILDGYSWKDNGDGTFTPGARGVRYGALDQYGMGLRAASEVPPFFLLEDITDLQGNPVPMMSGVARGGQYKGRKVELTVEDLIRAQGPRMPATDPAAEDLRMGVVLLGAPGVPVSDLIGEAAAIDNSRRLWTEFYNEAGGGRGKVCTELYRPCRGAAFEFSELQVSEATAGDGVVSPGESATFQVKVTNVGDVPAPARVHFQAWPALAAGLDAAPTAALGKGESAVVKVTAPVTLAAVCGQTVTVDLQSPGTKGPSLGVGETALGLQPVRIEGFEGTEAAGWKVNPDGTDTGEKGRWAVGQPQRSIAFAYTLQPGAAYAGEKAFATGLSAEEVDNVDGITTLESPPYTMTGVAQPVLSYRAYFVAAAFAKEVLVPTPTGTLKVLASLDGKPFVQIDELTGMATGWERRLVRLTDKLGAELGSATSVRLRFVAEEKKNSASDWVVEAAIDDVGIYSTVAACAQGGQPPGPPPPDGGAGSPAGPAPEAGCDCRVGASGGVRPSRGGLPLVGGLLLGAAWVWRRRRREPRDRS